MRFQSVLSTGFLLSYILISLAGAQPYWFKNLAEKEISFIPHQKADVIVLHDVGKIEISSNLSANIQIQTAYKILNSDGEGYATLTLPTSSHIKVKGIKGWVYTNDKEYKDLPKENVIEFSPQESSAYYDDNRMVMATLPAVEPGVIVGFEAEIEEKGWTSTFQNFTFQRSQPILFTKFELKIPDNWNLVQSEWKMNGIDYQKQGEWHVWTGTNLPYVEKEPLSPSWYYLSKRIVINCYDTEKKDDRQFQEWQEVANWCSTVYQEPATPGPEVTKIAQEITADKITFEDKIQTIADFMQKNIRYVGIEIGKERWQPRMADYTYYNRYGDCKDKTTLMRAMLKSVGISSAPVLANSKYPVDRKLPSPFQFDHCIIAIKIENPADISEFHNAVLGNWLFFDPTDPTVDIGEIPWALQGGTVLLGESGDSILYKLPYPDPEDYKRKISLTGEINPDGSFSASVSIAHFGGWASDEKYENQHIMIDKKTDQWKEYISEILPGCHISNFTVNSNSDSACLEFKLTGNSIFSKSGDYILLKPDIFQSIEPARLCEKTRRQPIWFGPPKETETLISWHYPADWIAVSTEYSTQEECRGAIVKSHIRLSDNLINYHTVYQQTGRLMPQENYQKAMDFCRKLSGVRSQTVLFTL
jgi:hypothetical protein